MPIPLLFYTDAPSHNTGLARICRELCAHIHANLSDVFRVGTLGVFGRGSAKYPWVQYSANGPDDALFNLRQVTEDFFQGERGILFSITPPSWLFALSLPQFMVREKEEWNMYSSWMATNPFEKWGYLAIESHGPFNQFSPASKAILKGLDRRLYYSRWGSDIARNSRIDEPDGIWRYIGHGIDTHVWKPAAPEDVRQFRNELSVSPNDILLGCVATNTRRKLLPLLFESAYLLRHQIGNARLKLWVNTDVSVREYNLNELAECFGFRLNSDLIITSSNRKRSDQWLATMYSACDLTALPTAGEGFGYPVIESLACGTPCVTTSFGAQAEFLQGWRDSWTCQPIATHLITNNTLVEPIYDPRQFASCMAVAWTEIRQRGSLLRDECKERGNLWSWEHVWPHWEKWFLYGAAELQEKLIKGSENKESNDVGSKNGSSVQTETVPSDSVGSPVGGDSIPAGQPTDLDSARGLDSGAPIGVGREAD